MADIDRCSFISTRSQTYSTKKIQEYRTDVRRVALKVFHIWRENFCLSPEDSLFMQLRRTTLMYLTAPASTAASQTVISSMSDADR